MLSTERTSGRGSGTPGGCLGLQNPEKVPEMESKISSYYYFFYFISHGPWTTVPLQHWKMIQRNFEQVEQRWCKYSTLLWNISNMALGQHLT